MLYSRVVNHAGASFTADSGPNSAANSAPSSARKVRAPQNGGGLTADTPSSNTVDLLDLLDGPSPAVISGKAAAAAAMADPLVALTAAGSGAIPASTAYFDPFDELAATPPTNTTPARSRQTTPALAPAATSASGSPTQATTKHATVTASVAGAAQPLHAVLAPDSSHSPLALDPLASLWQSDSVTSDPLGGPSNPLSGDSSITAAAPPAAVVVGPPGGVRAGSRSTTPPLQPHSLIDDDWGADVFNDVGAAAATTSQPPRNHLAGGVKSASVSGTATSSLPPLGNHHANNHQAAGGGGGGGGPLTAHQKLLKQGVHQNHHQGAHHHASSSTGDLLNLTDDEPSASSPSHLQQQHRRSTGAGVASAQQQAHMPPRSRRHSSSEVPDDSRQAAGRGAQQSGDGGQGAAAGTSEVPPNQEEGLGQGTEQRELHIYAIPLTREKLVFLPITAWAEEPKAPPQGVVGSVQSGINKMSESISNMWSNMGAKDPSTLSHKIYKHGQEVIENMSAEERLMRYIPKAATKVVVFHPAVVMPCEVQEQLQKMTSNFMMKATGKAAAAGVLLPIAVGIEMIAVPGTGWYALYQLYKSSVSVQGVSRLNQYLNHAKNVRVCYAGMSKLDTYVERAKLSPDGLLTQDDVDDLCHELEEPGLQHPLTELRNRYLKRVAKTGDYALLPANDAADTEGITSGSNGAQEPPKKEGFAKLAFWK